MGFSRKNITPPLRILIFVTPPLLIHVFTLKFWHTPLEFLRSSPYSLGFSIDIPPTLRVTDQSFRYSQMNHIEKEDFGIVFELRYSRKRKRTGSRQTRLSREFYYGILKEYRLFTV